MLAGDMLLFWSFLVLKRLDFDKVFTVKCQGVQVSLHDPFSIPTDLLIKLSLYLLFAVWVQGISFVTTCYPVYCNDQRYVYFNYKHKKVKIIYIDSLFSRHQAREAEPKEYDIKDYQPEKRNLHNSTYQRIGNVTDGVRVILMW